jgi:hypothetical protein
MMLPARSDLCARPSPDLPDRRQCGTADDVTILPAPEREP